MFLSLPSASSEVRVLRPQSGLTYRRDAGTTFNAARSYHAGGVNGLLSDGSVKFFKDSISVPI